MDGEPTFVRVKRPGIHRATKGWAGAGRPGLPAAIRRALGSPRDAASFAVIGVACTAAYAVLFAVFRLVTGALESNALALAVTVSANFAANRWLTFRDRRGPLAIDLAGYGVAYLLSVGVSTLALAAALRVLDNPSRSVEIIAGLASGLMATATRYALLQGWVFVPERRATNANRRPVPRRILDMREG